MSGFWEPEGEWNRLHGDKKSVSKGKFHMENMKLLKGNIWLNLWRAELR